MLIALLLLAIPGLSQSTEFYGLFVQGQRIGVISSTSTPTPSGKRTVTTTSIAAKILGDAATMKVVSDTLADSNGIVKSQVFVIESQGRTQTVTAIFSKNDINVTRTTGDSKERENKIVKIPEGAVIIDDATFVAPDGKSLKPGDKKTFYVFDPTLLNLVKNETEYRGVTEVEILGKMTKVTWVTMRDPRATAEYYLNPNGKMLLAKMMFGMEMRPISAEDAGIAGTMPNVDLAGASRASTDVPIKNARNLASLTLSLTGELPRLKSSAQQTLIRNQDGSMLLEIKPNHGSKETSLSIGEVAKQKPEWLSKNLNVPVGDPEFETLAKQILGTETNSFVAAWKICQWVHKEMTPFAGVAMLRDAKEILKTKQGVCRDYSTLAVTLLRTAKIPTKIVTGAVYAENGFYYHAWVEVWTGNSWIPMDPTFGTEFFDATHITFVEGNPEDAFVVFTFEGIKIKVVGSTAR